MSDTEKTDVPPPKQEEEEEEEEEMEEDKKEEKQEEEEEEKMEEDQEVKKEEEKKEESKVVEQSEKEAEPVKPTPKRGRKKVEKKEYDEDEELPLGLLERPVVIESGKREKRKVERLSMTMSIYSHQQNKKVDIPEGTGTKLGDCPRIENKILSLKIDVLTPLHRLLFLKKGTKIDTKANLKQFCGFSFSKEDKEYKSRLNSLGKMTLPVLKALCDILDIEKSGVKDEVVQRVMDFLMHPVDSGKELPKPKAKKRRGPKGDKKEKGVKRKKSEKKEGKKKKKAEEEDESDEENEDEDLDEDDDNEEEDEEDGDVDEEESEEEPPKKKKPKVESPKKEKKEKKENDKKEKKEKAEKKAEKKEPKKKKVEISSDENEDDDDSDSDTLASKKSGPPNNDELRDVVKKILDGANLEEVTMKTVVKQVYAKYPDFDLSDKKEFIKNTVKQLIS